MIIMKIIGTPGYVTENKTSREKKNSSNNKTKHRHEDQLY